MTSPHRPLIVTLAALLLVPALAYGAKAKAAKPSAPPAAKAEEKKPEAPAAATSDAKKAEEKKPDAPPAPPAAPELPERVVEKRSGEYAFRLTIKPGNLRPNRVADIAVEVVRMLEIPDPQTGDRTAVTSLRPIVTVKPPPGDGKKKDAPGPQRYLLAASAAPGVYGFHFTPTLDGVYSLQLEGDDAKHESEEPRSYEVGFKVGVGTAAAETEVSQGAASARRGARRPVGGTATEKQLEEKLQKLMEEVGHRFLALEDLLGKPPAKGPNADAAAEARALGALFANVKGMVPPTYAVGSGEFDKLAEAMPAKFEALAKTAEDPKDRAGPKAAFAELERSACAQCHAKYRYGVTTDLAAWPKFEQKGWK